MNKDGTISWKVKPRTEARLKRYGEMGDTIDALINRLLDLVEKKTKPKEGAA